MHAWANLRLLGQPNSFLAPDWAFERLLATATVAQRCLLGWPAPGQRYWSTETIAAVERRYGTLGFDGAPYRRAIEEAQRSKL
jgi:hypothetical protein